jgi:NADH-ubiquinone oxidoreductase chain 3
MTSTTFFFILVPVLAILLLTINLVFAPHNPYGEKDSVFECGFHSFLGQNRTQFSISFFIFALLFLLFDLEILLVYPYVVSAYINDIYGLTIMLIFFLALTLGFVFELGKNALKIESRQVIKLISKYKGGLSTIEWGFTNPPKPHAFVNLSVAKVCTLHGVTAGICQACWNLANPKIIACHHKWITFTQASLAGVSCDFGHPPHAIVDKTIAYTCDLCHAMSCSGCIG